MKACVIDRYGSNDVVTIRDVPEPTLRDDDVLIDVHAASVNPIDFKVRDGKLKRVRPLSLPLILGSDLSGVVAKVGPKVTRFRAGDAVFARVDKDRMGAFAERAAVSEGAVAKKPEGLEHAQAASIALVGLTSWQALVDEGKTKPGDKVLIHAGSGGVGTIAIQIAKHLGATVATTTSAKNVELVRSLGADVVVDYTKENFRDVLHDYDFVFETLGGKSELDSIAVLKRGGVMVSIAGLPDEKFMKDNHAGVILTAAVRLMTMKRTRLAKQRDVRYVYLFMRPDGAELAKLGELAAAGTLKTIIDRRYPLEQAKDALAYVESGRARGKVIVTVRESKG